MSEPRRATPADAEALTMLRREMFRAMGLDVDAPGWVEGCIGHFRDVLASDDTVAYVIAAPDGGGLAASGVIEFDRRLPGPGNATGWTAYISTMSTWPQWRRRGYARGIFSCLLREAEARDIQRVELHATEDGMPLYRSFGFAKRPGGLEMRLMRDTNST